jgi:hypothetical protein
MSAEPGVGDSVARAYVGWRRRIQFETGTDAARIPASKARRGTVMVGTVGVPSLVNASE